MCGITGFLDFNLHSTEVILQSMTNVLYHRGPDDSGYFLDRTDCYSMGLGHRRLSILDLSERGHQPMFFNGLTICYNGEVYNYKEVRVELEEKGYTFMSDTDTEVILKSYYQWGVSCLDRFIGMFAFVIYDKNKQKLLLFRDRAGVKPLYWYFRNNLFLFSSELKSFHEHPCFIKELDNNSLALYLQYGYIPQPYSIFKSAYKLKGGHYLTVDLKTRQIDDSKYWDVIDYYRMPKLCISEEEVIEQTENLLKSAFEYRMVSDVPVGMFLSGGIDSSVVTAMLQTNRTEKLKTFTIGFNETEYNEALDAKEIAGYLGTDHTDYYCTQKDALAILPFLPEIWDEPFGDSSAIPTTLVSRLAREQVIVSLSADGGDEAFGGYNKYTHLIKIKHCLARLPEMSHGLFRFILQNKITGFIADKTGFYDAKRRLGFYSPILGVNDGRLLQAASQVFTDSEIRQLLTGFYQLLPTDFNENINGSSLLDTIMAIDYKTYQIDDILTKVDRAGMSVSLEGREPLLDHRIIEFVARLSQNLKINGTDKKYLLKQIAYKYIPKKLLDRPKKGFAFPVARWLRSGLREYVLQYLDKERLEKQGIFNVNEVLDLRYKLLNYKVPRENINKIWFILIFQMWKDRWMA